MKSAERQKRNISIDVLSKNEICTQIVKEIVREFSEGNHIVFFAEDSIEGLKDIIERLHPKSYKLFVNDGNKIFVNNSPVLVVKDLKVQDIDSVFAEWLYGYGDDRKLLVVDDKVNEEIVQTINDSTVINSKNIKAFSKKTMCLIGVNSFGAEYEAYNSYTIDVVVDERLIERYVTTLMRYAIQMKMEIE